MGEPMKAGKVKPTGPKAISAVTRVLTILEKLASVPSANLEELSRAVALAKPTVYRFLATLRELGYVHRDDTDRYFLTMKLFAVGSKALDNIELLTVAGPIAERLSLELCETVHMGVLDEGEALYVLKIESKCTIRMYSRVGKKIPLYCTAIGKVLLASLEDEAKAAYLASLKLIPHTNHSLSNLASLEAELETIRREGIAADTEEYEEGVCCLAAPIRDHSGTTLAAISASWPQFRFKTDQRAYYSEQIKDAAAKISAILGAGNQ